MDNDVRARVDDQIKLNKKNSTQIIDAVSKKSKKSKKTKKIKELIEDVSSIEESTRQTPRWKNDKS